MTKYSEIDFEVCTNESKFEFHLDIPKKMMDIIRKKWKAHASEILGSERIPLILDALLMHLRGDLGYGED
jgi:hypothetical protein